MYYIDGENVNEVIVGATTEFVIQSRKQDVEEAVEPTFIVSIEDDVISKNPNIILKVEKESIPVTIKKRANNWLVTYKPTKAGINLNSVVCEF